MKILKYNLCTKVNHGTKEEPKIEEILSPITMGWNEANEEIAKREAYNGEVTVEEVADEEKEPTTEERLAAVEETTAQQGEILSILLSGETGVGV